jgi:epoxyqueuosine reductase QueG
MVAIFQQTITAEDIKKKALSLGIDLVGIAEGAVIDAYPPDMPGAMTPSQITSHDGGRVIVLAKHYGLGTTRIARWDERHKYYNDELTLTALEEASLELVLWLEDRGYPGLIIPPTHVDPWRYQGDPEAHMGTIMSLTHAAVEAGLGTLGLAEQLITPEYGPRVILTAVLSSVPVEPDRRHQASLCLGPACGRCVLACPVEAVHHWQRDWPTCDRARSPHGFAALAEHIDAIIDAPDNAQRKAMLRSKDHFYLWQSILRGAGVVTGCRRCQDVCPVGADYAALADALETIPEATPGKEQRLEAMRISAAQGEVPAGHSAQARWFGELPPPG